MWRWYSRPTRHRRKTPASAKGLPTTRRDPGRRGRTQPTRNPTALFLLLVLAAVLFVVAASRFLLNPKRLDCRPMPRLHPVEDDPDADLPSPHVFEHGRNRALDFGIIQDVIFPRLLLSRRQHFDDRILLVLRVG